MKHILCRDKVLFHLHQYENEKLTEIRRASAWEIELDQTTGKTSARGPGWLVFWTRNKGNPKMPLLNVSVNASEKTAKKKKKKWDYMRVDFAGTMEGNIRHRISTLHDRVRVLYGPVKKPLDTIDRDELPEDAGWLSAETLEILQKKGSKKNNTDDSFDLKAEKNAVIQGKLFRARAAQVTYDSAKKLFTLRANGSGFATIWRREKLGQKAAETNAKMIRFSPVRNQIEFDRTTGIQATTSR